MKCFYLIGILLLGICFCKYIDEDSQEYTDDGEFYKYVKKELGGKCIETGGVKLLKKLSIVLDNMQFCLGLRLPKNAEEIRKFYNSSEASTEEQLCTGKRFDVQDCVKDFFQVLKECSKHHTSLADFLLHASKTVGVYICTNEKNFFLKIANSIDCFSTVLMEIKRFLDVCDGDFEILKKVVFTPQDSAIQQLLCKGLQIGETCYGKFIKAQCPRSDFNELLSGIYGPLVKTACDKMHKRSIPTRFRLH